LPNAKILDTTIVGETITSIAAKDIGAGEEIYICYKTNLQSRTPEERCKAPRFPVSCNCRACLPGTTFHPLRDMRRKLIRGLSYLIQGVDIDGSKSTTIIVDL
jgi:hypothetical protein